MFEKIAFTIALSVAAIGDIALFVLGVAIIKTNPVGLLAIFASCAFLPVIAVAIKTVWTD